MSFCHLVRESKKLLKKILNSIRSRKGLEPTSSDRISGNTLAFDKFSARL